MRAPEARLSPWCTPLCSWATGERWVADAPPFACALRVHPSLSTALLAVLLLAPLSHALAQSTPVTVADPTECAVCIQALRQAPPASGLWNAP